MAVSNSLTAILNFIAFICSIPIIAAGIWLASKPDNECLQFYRWPVLILGILVLLVSLAGFLGAYLYRETLLALYLCCMAILICLLLFVLIFAFVVTTPDGSYHVPARAYKEYRLNGFSGWLRNHIVSSDNWANIQSCLAQTSVCAKMNRDYITADQFFAAHISPLQSGCCKPPTMCGYNYVNPTTWVSPTNPTGDPDCMAWNNNQHRLCYACNSCRAGFLGSLREEWRKSNMILIVAVVVLICVYVIGCSAYRNAQTEGHFRRFKRGWI